jgi:hypothetical protein
METAWVRIASSVQAPKTCTLEAMRTQAVS